MTGTEAHKKTDVTSRQPETSPRKRKRRAPASGAANDCFTCQELKRSCDRRRPYCTQCLGHGKDCSGYKTTLTWNVGVASRGKLRGLSLPIAESKKVLQQSDAKPNKKKNSSKQLKEHSASHRESQYPPTSQPGNPLTDARTTKYNFINLDPSLTTSSSMLPPPDIEWRPIPSFQGGYSRQAHKRFRRHSLKPIQVPALHSTRDFEGLPMSANVLSAYADQDFRVSVECSPTASSFSGFEPYHNGFRCPSMVSSPFESNFIGHEGAGWRQDNTGSSLSSDQSTGDYLEDDAFFADPVVATTLDDLLSSQHILNSLDLPPSCDIESVEVKGGAKFLSRPIDLVPDDCGAHPLVFPRVLQSLSIGKTPSLQFLIDYYDRVISPVIIAFDGPSNPYRSHVLSLAAESESLQHAIAALSASNLRQRRAYRATSTNHRQQNYTNSMHGQSVRKSSSAHSIMNVGQDQFSETAPGEPSIEELYHKAASINALNEQLADINRRTDDSVLATLLILCLYHICDTGVAKFKIQFAGVKKILALRRSTAGCNLEAVNWLTLMFTWFDAMTATVNDREGQLPGDDIDITTLETGEWTLEKLAGCDTGLFIIIANLGRLNLLSQNKPVRDEFHKPRHSRIGSLPISGIKGQDYYSMNYNLFDENACPTVEDDSLTLKPRSRAQFWKEWNETRNKLRDWRLDPPVPSSGSGTMQRYRTDLSNISEAFRYSALLYIERLANPHLPSAHSNFQHLVTQALHYITKVEADVFMLWPLFITGTECVSEQGRFLIRERCLDLQKDSGVFNNISCLELLEKAWRDDAIDELNTAGGFAAGLNNRPGVNANGHGFKWRKAIEKVDGEYIVV